jgi:hypothetical protein
MFSQETDCGTAYCAAGWAVVDPWFREHTDLGATTRLREDGSLKWLIRPAWEVLAWVFGLSGEEVSALFYPDKDRVTKEEVLINIDRLIAGRPARLYSQLLLAP